MADKMREKTTNVGGIIKRIWYAMTGETQGAELMSIDDAGKFKCVSGQISGLAGTSKGMVIADKFGNLNLENSKIKNVKFYGAIGDGVVDDTASINLAISDLQDGGTLYFPFGNYKITNTLTISSKANISIISDFGILQNHINDNSKNLMRIQNCNKVKMYGISFDVNLNDLLSCLDIYNVRYGLSISGLSFTNFKNHAQFGIKLENIGADNSNYYTPTYTITNCDFYNVNNGGYATRDYNANNTRGTGIWLSNWSEYGSISNCNFFNLSSAILSDGGANTIITSNNFYLCGQKSDVYSIGSVIYFRNNSSNYAKTIISNNNFNHNYYYCVYYTGASQIITISDNNFIANLYTTLGLVNLKNSKIQNNYFEICNNFANAPNYPTPNTGSSSYVVLYDSSRNLISGNIFKDNAGAKNAIETLNLSTKNTIINNTYQSLSVFVNAVGTNNVANNYDVT